MALEDISNQPESGPRAVVSVIITGFKRVQSAADKSQHLQYSVLCSGRYAKMLLAPQAPMFTWEDANMTATLSKDCEPSLVQRRYSDFEKLRTNLVAVAAKVGLAIPKLPSKLTFGQGLDTIGAARQKALQDWLEWIMARPWLARCHHCKVFLGLVEAEEDSSPRTVIKLLPAAHHLNAGKADGSVVRRLFSTPSPAREVDVL